MLLTVVTVIHVLLAAGLIGIVLLQKGKGAEAGAAFGAGASGTVFGARGSASFLSRATAVMATLFFVTSLSLAYLSSERRAPTSVLEQMEQGAPAGEGSSLMSTGEGDELELPAPPEEPPAAGEDKTP